MQDLRKGVGRTPIASGGQALPISWRIFKGKLHPIPTGGAQALPSALVHASANGRTEWLRKTEVGMVTDMEMACF